MIIMTEKMKHSGIKKLKALLILARNILAVLNRLPWKKVQRLI